MYTYCLDAAWIHLVNHMPPNVAFCNSKQPPIHYLHPSYTMTNKEEIRFLYTYAVQNKDKINASLFTTFFFFQHSCLEK